MLSKSGRLARTRLIALLLTACSSAMPWHDEPVATEVNLAFTVQNNLLYLSSAMIDDHKGRYFFGSAEPRSVLDRRFAAAIGTRRTYALQLRERESIRFSPALLDLGNSGDALIGADIFDAGAVTIDYHDGLLTYQKEGIHPELMTLFRFTGEPSINVRVDGRAVVAIVDTAVPDTLILPGEKNGREKANVTVAGIDFGSVDVRFANIPQARIGNRLLSKFLVTIDYRRQQVGLWRDPRIPMHEQ